MDDNDELGYVSSVDPYQADDKQPSIDAPDEKALVGIMRLVEDQIKLFHTIDGVKQFDKALTLEQRFELCDKYVALLFSLKQKVDNAINGIKEAQNAGR